VADLYRHGYSISDLVLSDSACERILDALPAADVIGHPTVVAMIRDPRFAAAIGEPGLAPVKARILDGEPEAWQQAGEVYSVRVQLDVAGGSTRVIPMSHRQGKVSEEEIARLAATGPIAELAMPQGAMLVMAPLLVHTAPRRRVLQIELATGNDERPPAGGHGPQRLFSRERDSRN